MFFKFARDTFGVYGGDEAAGKSAGHELRSLNALVGCNVTGLAVPLMATIDYLYGMVLGQGADCGVLTCVCVCVCVCACVCVCVFAGGTASALYPSSPLTTARSCTALQTRAPRSMPQIPNSIGAFGYAALLLVAYTSTCTQVEYSTPIAGCLQAAQLSWTCCWPWRANAPALGTRRHGRPRDFGILST